MSENNWLGTWFLKNISENTNSNSQRMESLDDDKQGPGEDAANKYEKELYNISAELQSKRTKDENNFLTGISITLTISTTVMS